MLIDFSYFVGEINIPNTDRPAVQENLQLFINKYEAKFLQMLLGTTLYAEYVAGIVPVPVEPATDPVTYLPIPEKWANLQNKLRDTTTKVSPIANFIYFYTTRDKTLLNGGTGVVAPEGENAQRGDSKIKTTRAWNEMCELTFEVYKFLKGNEAIYGPVPYSLRFRDNWLTWDWYYWWTWYPVVYRAHIPEIYQSINTSNW